MPINRDQIAALINRYEQQRPLLRRSSSTFSEADTRSNFIDPFFAALGWDINNEKGLSQRLREVIRETQVQVNANTKKPDYVFKLGPERRFFTEAKKPNVDILRDTNTSFQVRRYGWSAGLLVSVITNFENLIIYDTTTQPDPNHNTGHSRLHIFSYKDYLEKIDQIALLLSRESVYSGEFDNQFSAQAQRQGIEAIDKVFLETLNTWRITLGTDLLRSYSQISSQLLNEIVQRFILRVLFLRMCEDRGIETYEKLKNIAQMNNWSAFIDMFRESNRKYDSELFSTANDPFFLMGDQAIQLDSTIVQTIINELYFPNAPYTFSVVEPEFLGDIYEQFLIERLEIDDGFIALRPKPENVDRDVVPTPRPIIERLVQETLDSQLAGLTPEQILNFKIVDPACGSGGFLVAAFEVLTDRAITAYESIADLNSYYENPNGKHLTFERKAEILTKCIHGVDRDNLAVEVARFSLLTKLLENESPATLPNAVNLLPPISRNVVCGDSLIDDRIYEGDHDPELIGTPLNWGDDVHAPYSIVLGNPPYLFTEAIRNIEPTEYEYYREYYKSAFRQFDKYYLFIERALNDLMEDDGHFGMVVSRKFTHIESGKKLRGIISRGRHLVRLVDFGTAQMFQGKTTYTCLLFLSKRGVPEPEDEANDTIEYELVTTPQDWLSGLVGNYSNTLNLPRKLVEGEQSWLLPSTHEELKLILALNNATIPLGEIFDVFNGIQTSSNPVYMITQWREVDDSLIAFTKDDQERLIEKDIVKPFFDDKFGELKSFLPMPITALVIFPYDLVVQEEQSLKAQLISPDVMENKYPYAYDWLKFNKDSLLERDIRSSPYPENEWYRYGRDQALTSFENRPKIVVGVNSLGDKYVYDESNTLLASGGTAGECAIAHFRESNRRSQYDLHFILAILNHKAIEFFCRKRGSPFRGGWFARGTAVLKDIPVPLINFDDPNGSRIEMYNAVIDSCREVCDINRSLAGVGLSQRERQRFDHRRRALKNRMDNIISNLYNISQIIDNIQLPR